MGLGAAPLRVAAVQSLSEDDETFGGGRDPGPWPANGLRTCLQEQEAETIREVSVILFATFAGLLATVIGERLTWSLLQQIWPDTLLPDTELQETEEDHASEGSADSEARHRGTWTRRCPGRGPPRAVLQPDRRRPRLAAVNPRRAAVP
jgi:hypothetical protein